MKNTISDIQYFKKKSAPFSAVTVYDYPTSLIINETNIPMVLVGDSASMVVYGYNNTIPISIDELLLLTKAVKRGIKSALIVADMPFLSYQPSNEEAIQNAGLLIKSGGADAVKLEGGIEYAERVSKIIEAGIPVVGHVGLKPQSILTDSGYKIHGKKGKEALKIYQDAVALESAGVFSIVLDGIELIAQRRTVWRIGYWRIDLSCVCELTWCCKSLV